ncbi:arginine deiminase family protein, partial [Planctomycetota bacterium]|nr:arginine deiminase family protein [Planctomycetota bacterium]
MNSQDRTIAIVRSPGAALADCELTHLDRIRIDATLAAEQHAAYARILGEAGLEVLTLEPLEGFPDACFVEDPAIALPGRAVLTRPGAASRRGEVDALGRVLQELVPVERVSFGSLDGGDVLQLPDRILVGLSTRTNAAGIESLAQLSSRPVFGIPVRGALHLKTAMSWLRGDQVLADPRALDVHAEGLEGLELVEADPDEPAGANVLKVSDQLVVSKAAPRTADRLQAMGLSLHPVDISEFHKAEAGLTCLSLLIGPAAH